MIFEVLVMLIAGFAGGIAGAAFMEAFYQRRSENTLLNTLFEEKEKKRG